MRDVFNKTYGRLTVVSGIVKDKNGVRSVIVKCSCGNRKTVQLIALTSDRTTSCGCYQRESVGARKRTHGLSKHPLYSRWRDMKRRCNNAKHPFYDRYGGRGIRYHPSFETFEGFLNTIPEGWKPGLTMDRKDNDLDYDPSNIRWVDQEEQMNNISRNNEVTDPLTGESLSVSRFSRKYGISRMVVYNRLEKGVFGKELIEPPRRKNGTFSLGSSRLSLEELNDLRNFTWSNDTKEVSAFTGIPEETLIRLRDREIFDDYL